MQSACVLLSQVDITIELPDQAAEVVPGVHWGQVEAFPSPAYWAYQVLARRISGTTIQSRLGRTLEEEVAGCLLGGHGIPAAVGLAAFASLHVRGAFASSATPNEAQLLEWLSEPLDVGGKPVRYRFARQKARYLAQALQLLRSQPAPAHTGRALRDWLLDFPGIGYKTASWIARNWLGADDVAILDIHVLRAGYLAGVFPSGLSVEKHYLQLEELYLTFSAGLGVRPSELDAVVWFEMMSSRRTVESITADLIQSGRELPSYFPK